MRGCIRRSMRVYNRPEIEYEKANAGHEVHEG